MAVHDEIGRLVGNTAFEDLEITLMAFWKKYSICFPSHQVFQEGNGLDLRRCIPVYMHGDEGRSFKKSGVLLINLQGAIGKGSEPFLKKHELNERFRQISMGLNIGGHSLHSFASRLLYCSMQRKFYAKQPQVLENLLDNLATQLLRLQQGFEYRQQKWHIVLLGVKGDLPWLTKAAGFQRHFLRAQRSLNRKSKEPPVGVCFLCHAGRSRVPYEDFSDGAAWTRDGCDLPWSRAPSMSRLYHDPFQPSALYKLDIFHNFHGGAGKDWVASAMTEALSLIPGTSRDAKIDSMAQIMRQWGRIGPQNRPHSGDFCVDRIGLTSYQVCPDSSWSKHNDTTIYMRFLQYFLHARPEHAQNEKLSLIYKATCAINLSFQLLYEAGLFIPQATAQRIASLGRFWLQAYAVLAAKSHSEGVLRFPLHTKLHYLDHAYRQLQAQASHASWVYNILNESVQMDEAAQLCTWFCMHACNMFELNKLLLRILSGSRRD